MNPLEACLNSNDAAQGPTLRFAIDDPFVAGYAHSMALTNAGHLYAFGDNSNGQLGIPDQDHLHVPTQVASAVKFTDVSCGYLHTVSNFTPHIRSFAMPE